MGKSGGRIQKNLLKSWERKHALVIGTLADILFKKVATFSDVFSGDFR